MNEASFGNERRASCTRARIPAPASLRPLTCLAVALPLALACASTAEARIGLRGVGITTTVPQGSTTTIPSGSTTVPESTTTLPAATTTTVAQGSSTTSTSTTLPGSSLCARIVDFEDQEEGAIVFNLDGDHNTGIHVHGANPLIGDDTNSAVAFDSSCPGGCSGGDPDLGTPNKDFGGPGVGDGGKRGRQYENAEALGKILIVAENLDDDDGDGLVDNPDDQAQSAVSFGIDFSDNAAVVLRAITVIDVEPNEGVPGVALFEDELGDMLAEVPIPATGDNGVVRVEFPRVEGASLVDVSLFGSGAIDNIEYEIDCNDDDECTEDSCSDEGGCVNEPIPDCGGTTTTSLGGTTTTSLGATTTTTVGGTTTTTTGGTTTTLGVTTTTLGGGGTTTTAPSGSTTTVPSGSTTTVPSGSTTTVPGGSTTTVPGGSTTTLPGTGLCGDADADGNVSARDALLTLKSAVGANACAACDVDASAAVTAGDALRVLQYAIGIDVDLSCS